MINPKPLLICVALLFVTSGTVCGQRTIIYNNGDDDGTNYTISPPNNPTSLTIDSGAATQSGVLRGVGRIIKTGAGTLTLSGDNTFLGRVTVTDGTLIADSDRALGFTPFLTIDGPASTGVIALGVDITGRIDVNNGASLEIDGTTRGNRQIASTGGGSVEISESGLIERTGISVVAINMLGGGVVNNAGALDTLGATADGIRFGAAGGELINSGLILVEGLVAGGVAFAGGVSRLNNSGDITVLGGVNVGVRFDGLDSELTNSGSILASGAGGVGVLFNNGGMLENSGSINESNLLGVGVFGNGAPLTINNRSGGIISGDSRAIILNAGGMILNESDALIQGDGFAIQAGAALQLTNAGEIIGDVVMSSADDQLTLLGGVIAGDVTLGGGNNELILGGDTGPLIFSEAITGSLTGLGTLAKIGSNTWILDRDFAPPGGTTINAGELQIGNGGTEGSISGNVTNHGFIIFNRSDDITFDNTITGTGGFGKLGEGRLELSGSNSGGLGTFINAGILAVTGTINHTGGNVVVGNGADSNAMIEISGNGSVSGASGFVGFGDGSNGMARVTGGTWMNTSSMVLGAFGNGTLEISGTGMVTSNGGILGLNNDANGTVRISSGSWINSSIFEIGASGDGILEISNTGALSNTIGLMGTESTSTGSASISGGTWTNSIGLTIGDNGQGIVNLTGGTLNAPTIQLATAMGATGTLHFGTGTTVGTLNANLISGGDGAAVVNLNHTSTATFAPNLQGSLAVNKLASGTTILTGTNTYTGPTMVSAGELRLLGSLGNTALTVQSGARFSGTGTTVGAVVIENGGRISPGTSPGTLTTGNLTLNPNSQIDFDLDTPDVVGGGVNDLIVVNGNLQLDGTVNITKLGNFGDGIYRLFNYTGTLTDNGLLFGIAPVPIDFTIDTSTANQVNLLVAAATAQFWDGINTTPSGTIGGGSGIWDATTTNWTNTGGNTNTLWAGGLTAVFAGAAGTVTIADGFIANPSALDFQTAGYNLAAEGSGKLTIAGVTTVTTVSGMTTVSAPITGPGSLEKLGEGTLILTGENPYTGGTTITDGTLQIGNGGSTGSIVGRVVNHAKLVFNRSDEYIFDDTISGTGALRKEGAGTLIMTKESTYVGGTTINAGNVKTQNPGALGTGRVTINGGSLQPVGTLSIHSLDWNGGTLVMNLGTNTSFVDMVGDLTLAGGGEFVFSADDGFLGNTPYQILSAANLNNIALSQFSGNLLFGIDPTFTRSDANLFVTFFGAEEGPVIQNSGPIFTPVDADFTVNGPVRTGSPLDSNTVNSLTFNSGSSLQVFNNLTVTSGNFHVRSGRASLNGGNVIAPGEFNKNGGGTLDTTGFVDVGGNANIREGTLLVNGNLTVGETLTVMRNGRLGGTGIINGNVRNNGLLTPGNSPGLLTIDGDFAQNASGILEIEATDLSTFDQLVVRGVADLNGSLQFLPLNGFRPAYGQQFAFLQADDISGTFSSIVVPNNFRGRFVNQGRVGILLFAPDSYTRVATNQNQFNVARALDSFIPAANDDREVVSTALDLLVGEQYPAAFDQIMPAFHESVTSIGVNLAQTQGQLIQQQLSSVRLGGRGFRTSGISMEPLSHDKDGTKVADAKSFQSEVVMESPSSLRWSSWVQGNGIFSRAATLSAVPDYRSESGGFLVGADYEWSESFVTGVFAGYQYLSARYDNGADTKMNGVRFGGYATYDPVDSGFYADAVVWGGASNFKTRRKIEFSNIERTARASQDTGEVSALLGGGYDWHAGNFTFGPALSVQYTYFGVAPFTESGADSLDLRVDQQNANSLQSYLGARVAYTAKLAENIVLIPEVRMFWQHEFLNNPRSINASLNGGDGVGFDYRTQNPSRDSVWAGTGATLQFGERINTYFYYNADFGGNDYISHVISTGLGLSF